MLKSVKVDNVVLKGTIVYGYRQTTAKGSKSRPLEVPVGYVERFQATTLAEALKKASKGF